MAKPAPKPKTLSANADLLKKTQTAPKAFPKALGACADLLKEMQTARLLLAKQVEAMESEESRLKEYIINNLPKGDTGAVGKFYKVMTGTKQVPRVVDWDLFYKHLARTKNFELMQKRLSDAAIKERFDNRKPIPGVEMISVVTVSLTKA